MKKIFLAVILAVTGLVLSSNPAWAAKPEIYVKKGGAFSSGWEYAIDGYDAVAYFTEGKPVKGKAEFQTEYKGVNWVFSSQENLDSFKADPDKYRPVYGGYCAYAVSQGSTASGDPEVWYIEDGKLYLNYSKGIQRRWLKDIPGYIEAANNNWPKVLN